MFKVKRFALVGLFLASCGLVSCGERSPASNPIPPTAAGTSSGVVGQTDFQFGPIFSNKNGWIIGAGGVWNFPQSAPNQTHATFPYGKNQVFKRARIELASYDQGSFGIQFQVPPSYSIIWYGALGGAPDCFGSPGENQYGAVPGGNDEAKITSAILDKGVQYTLFLFDGAQGYQLIATIPVGTKSGRHVTFKTPFENATLPCDLYFLLGHQ